MVPSRIKLEVSAPQPPQMQMSAPTPKNLLLSFEEQANSPLKAVEWMKDGLCTYSGGCIYCGGETRHSWYLDFKNLNLTLNVKVNCSPKQLGS